MDMRKQSSPEDPFEQALNMFPINLKPLKCVRKQSSKSRFLGGGLH